MKLWEYEGKQIFAREGIPVLKGRVATSPAEAEDVAGELGYPVVLKAQLLSGGRGKRGGIKFATGPEELRGHALALFTAGVGGETVGQILVEEKAELSKEFYISLTIDASLGQPVLLASAQGGVDIEAVPAAEIVLEPVDIFLGLRPDQVRRAIKPWGLDEPRMKEAIDLVMALYRIFEKYDAELVEINPLGLTQDGRLVALDAKIIVDDNAIYRQREFVKTRDRYDNELEYRAAQHNLNYVKLDGNIGILCTGAGLTLATLDLIAKSGGRAANFLESGGANYANAFHGLQLVLSDPEVKVLLINTFGLVSRSDVICRGLADVLKELKPAQPIVACIRGTGEEEGRRIFKEELGITPFTEMTAAIQEAIRLAGDL